MTAAKRKPTKRKPAKRKPTKAAAAKTPPATPAQGLMPSSETCIKIAKALKEFDGED
ncbi:MAG: hypothetical protein VB835_14070 [Pirellulales bacterium]